MTEKLSEAAIEKIYEKIKNYHAKFLKHRGVKMPKLRNSEGYTKDALILIYLAKDYPETTKIVTKSELTQFVRHYYPDVNDMQQARHLGAQKGWFILAGGREDIGGLERGDYQLLSLETPYPAFDGHRIENTEDWESIKKQYNFRCATCGSEEKKPNIHWPNTITKLQKSHMDPNKPLVSGNIIPQCQKCNRADRNNWVYDERGRAIKVANPNIITRSDEFVRRAMHRILKKEFEGDKKNESQDVK